MPTLKENLERDKQAFIEGGPGSGNHGHAGRPGERGGSASAEDEGGKKGSDARPGDHAMPGGIGGPKVGDKGIPSHDEIRNLPDKEFLRHANNMLLHYSGDAEGGLASTGKFDVLSSKDIGGETEPSTIDFGNSPDAVLKPGDLSFDDGYSTGNSLRGGVTNQILGAWRDMYPNGDPGDSLENYKPWGGSKEYPGYKGGPNS